MNRAARVAIFRRNIGSKRGVTSKHEYVSNTAEGASGYSERRIRRLNNWSAGDEPHSEPQSATVAEVDDINDQGDAAHECRLAELEQTLGGVSPSMAAIRQLILEVAPTRASVMIYGESGTGKELVAQAIHRYSKQSNGPFVPVNMAAIPHGPGRESALWSREGRIHQRGPQSEGLVRSGRRRHAVSR